jgi:hypothetical protein
LFASWHHIVLRHWRDRHIVEKQEKVVHIIIFIINQSEEVDAKQQLQAKRGGEQASSEHNHPAKIHIFIINQSEEVDAKQELQAKRGGEQASSEHDHPAKIHSH